MAGMVVCPARAKAGFVTGAGVATDGGSTA